MTAIDHITLAHTHQSVSRQVEERAQGPDHVVAAAAGPMQLVRIVVSSTAMCPSAAESRSHSGIIVEDTQVWEAKGS